MSLAVQCAAGTMRVYEYKKAHGCKPITKCFRARISSKGKRIWGSPCSNVVDAVESLRQIANHREDNGMVLTGVTESAPAAEKAGQKRSRLLYEAAQIEGLGPHAKTAKHLQAGQTIVKLVTVPEEVKNFEPAVSQPKGGRSNWSRALQICFEGSPCPGRVRLFRRAKDQKVKMSLSGQEEKRVVSKWHSSNEDALQCILTAMKGGCITVDLRP